MRLAFGPSLVSVHGMIMRRYLGLSRLAALGLIASATLAGASGLSPMAPPPNWTTLEPYQKTITRKEFARLIDQVYSPDGGFWKYVKIDDGKAAIFADTAQTHPLFTLHFAADQASASP